MTLELLEICKMPFFLSSKAMGFIYIWRIYLLYGEFFLDVKVSITAEE